MDVLKFKQLAGSMREAFGVQAQIKSPDIPKGTSIIAQEFSPGRPEPTPINEVRQFTVNNDMNTLDVRTNEGQSLKEMTQQGLEEALR
jgi:chemotaxis protein MotB